MNTVSHDAPSEYRYPNRTDKIQSVRRIRDGAAIHDIAQEFRVSDIMVRGWLKEYNNAASQTDPEPMQIVPEPKQILITPLSIEEENMAKTTAQTKKNFTDEQKIDAVRQHLSGVKTGKITEKLGISHNTLYNWKDKYSDKIKKTEAKVASLSIKNMTAAKTVAHSKTSFKGGIVNENIFLKNIVINQIIEIERLKGNLD